jgi:hypothetical protein
MPKYITDENGKLKKCTCSVCGQFKFAEEVLDGGWAEDKDGNDYFTATGVVLVCPECKDEAERRPDPGWVYGWGEPEDLED